ncbi:MAG TPA: uracil-DNA glycosylase family protein [Candidatus Dormibacteraeota bacterium]|nr:uracil-DNA glycosylase family protein [Candidatus Dormibacteraeota bacterium]
MFQGAPGQRLMLVGQAPGVHELGPRKPFAARSGAELARWMVRAGFTGDDQFRRLAYITSVTKCFPGKARTGAGDRRPSRTEVGQCRSWLDSQLDLARPRLLILVGGLAHEAFPATAGKTLDQLIGSAFDADGINHSDRLLEERAVRDDVPRPWYLPLPHPSGASRWLNLPAHREALERGLAVLGRLWPALVD